MARMTALRCRLIEDMKIRNLSPVTQRCYVHAVGKFARHFIRSPDPLGLAEVRAYQIHLTSTGTSWAAFNVAVSALRFFYGVTLGRSAIVERIPYARKQQQLPVILERRRGRTVFRSGAEPEASHRADGGLRRRPAGLRSGASEDHRYRQQPHADPGRLYPGRDDHDQQYDQPVRPAQARERHPGLICGGHGRFGGGGHLPPPR